MSDNDKKTEYEFGGIEEFNLQQIEEEILNESIYLDVFAGSDLRFKKEVQPLTGDLDKITALKGYSYKYKTEDFLTCIGTKMYVQYFAANPTLRSRSGVT